MWGREEHVRALLGDRVRDLLVRRDTVRVGLFARPEDFRDYFKARYGPTVATYQNIAAARPAPPRSTRNSPTSPAAMITAPQPPSWTGNIC